MKKKYIWLLIIGIIALLFGILFKLNILPIDSIKKEPVLETLLTVLFEGIIAFGSGLIVAFFSTKVKISDKIDEMLSNSGKGKLVSDLLISHGTLSDYKKTKVKYIVDTDEEYRTGTVYNVNASIKDNKVIVEATLSYTVHLSPTNPEPINVRFDSKSSKIDYIKISDPKNSNNTVQLTPNKILHRECDAHGNGLIYENYCNIPEKFKEIKILNIEKKYTLYGEDHWICYGVVFEHLTEGVTFSLNLSPDLKIKETTIFEKKDVFNKEETPSGITLRTTQWLSRYSGFMILISKK